VRKLNGGIGTPPLREVQSNNVFAPLTNLADTILEDELVYRLARSAYAPPELQGYRVPRLPTSNAANINAITTTGNASSSKRRGRRGRQRKQTASTQHPEADLPPETPRTNPFQRLREWWNAVWTVQESDSAEDDLGDMQPEIEIGADHSIFT
jgi:hypothetical protein